MRLAVIPARGGSKRIPRKNIKPFAGRPMIHHAIAGARAAGVFDRIVVSTDDAEIAALSAAAGAEVPFMRPPELADDHAGTVEVIAHAIETLAAQGWQAAQVCCIYPGVPMLEADDLRQALALLDAGGCDYVFPVAAFPAAVQRALRRDAQGRTSAMHPEHTMSRSQDLEPAYFDAGQFYWGAAAAWCAGRHPHQQARSIVLPLWRVADIDTPDDWARAEALYQALHSARSGAAPCA
ncbi:pseudaminic acid cytidylyltransferase [Ideonella sp. A 288]|uniref:pseudaminic acid cytidylyltransferase n=1 Tax=Ideonella sp. A 288 TaxID=1962181 RepID=UPI000B4AC873|nr:pseudaminic acid cytidylyltransferase [Ideonella sp. A 288]